MRYEEGSLIFLVGDRGVGKTTLLAKLAKSLRKQKHTIYCNFEMKGTEYFKTKQFGKVKYPKGSVIIIDECAIEYNSREFKTFNKAITKFIKLSRHHHVMIIVASQSYNDTDKVIRDNSTSLYLLQKVGKFTIAKKIINKLVLVPSQNGNSGYMGFDLLFAGLLTQGSRILCFRPLYYKYFDSWTIDTEDNLPPVESVKIPLDKGMK